MADDADLPAGEPRQGDYLSEIRELPILNARGEVDFVSTPHGVVVITQCCDLARGGKGYAHVAPVVILSGDEAAGAKSGRSPRFVWIPRLGENHFVDLGTICSVENGLLKNTTRRKFLPDDWARHMFGRRVGRRFSRFAVPDEFSPMLQRLKDLVRRKYGRSGSSFGQALEQLAHLQLEVLNEGGWKSKPPWDLTLLLIVKKNRLPTLPMAPDGSTAPDGSAQRDPQNITDSANAILRLKEGDPLLWDAWQSFGDSLVDKLKGDGEWEDCCPMVVGMQAEVLDEGDVLLSRSDSSVDIDLADLSSPVDDGT